MEQLQSARPKSNMLYRDFQRWEGCFSGMAFIAASSFHHWNFLQVFGHDPRNGGISFTPLGQARKLNNLFDVKEQTADHKTAAS